MIQTCKKIYLCSPDLKAITCLNGVETNSVNFSTHVKDYSVLKFNVSRFLSIEDSDTRISNYVESSGYENLKVMMYLYLEDIGYFQMQAPRIISNGNREYKQITAYSIEKEFEQKDWFGLKINTGETDSIEYLASNNINAIGFAKEYVTLCNDSNHELSFIHLVLSKTPGWQVGHIDSTIKTKRIPFISIDNTNLYALMTSEVAPRLKCLFVFDFLEKKVNVYDQNNIDFDTNIFISYRNLARSINISVDEDSVYTRFRVRGNDDLLLNDWNLNSDIITDISYFLCEPYMSEELATKVKNWNELRERLRLLNADYASQQIDLQEKLDKLKYTVPSDPCYWKNWDGMNEEGLRENLSYYSMLLRNLQISVDDRDDDVKFEDPEDFTTYKPVTLNNGKINHDYYLNRLYSVQYEYSGYYTYMEIIEYIIPYILQAIRNLELPEDQQVKYGNEAEENWKLYGLVELEAKRKSYELDKIPAMEKYSRDWDRLTPEEKVMYVNEEGYNTQGHDTYLHLVETLGDEETPGTIKYCLKELKEKIDAYQTLYDEVTELRTNVVELSKIDAYNKNKNGELDVLISDVELIPFTDDEISLIETLYVETDYTNSNILTTSADTTQMILNIEKDLYEDSIDMLSEASQPQYKFSVELDNLLRIKEFESWYDDFRLLRFIRLGIRDDYAVKLRIIGYDWNPCEVTPNLTIEFSNMISSRRGRTDLDDLIDNRNTRSQKNSISIGTGRSRTDQEYISKLIQVLMGNSIFTKGIADLASEQPSDNLDVDEVNGIIDDYFAHQRIRVNNVVISEDDYEDITENLDSDGLAKNITKASKSMRTLLGNNLLSSSPDTFSTMFADNISAATIDVGQLTGDSGSFDSLFSNYLQSDTVVSKLISADSAEINELLAHYADIQELNVTKITGTTAEFEELFSRYINVDMLDADEIVAKVLQADSATINNLQTQLITADVINTRILGASEAVIDYLSSQIITADNAVLQNVIADSISAADIEANTITVDKITGTDGEFTNFFVEHMKVNDIFGNNAQFKTIVSDSITTNDITTKLANIDQANVGILFADNAFTQNLQTISSTAATSVITDAYIYNAVANKITVGDLAVGDITISDNMRILSENGGLIMNGTALQIIGQDEDGNDYVGVQLGYDTTSTPSLILRNSEGNVVLSPSGITQDAVADGLIVNNMIHQGTISKDRLSFSVIEPNAQGGIDITQVYDGSGNNWGIEYNSFKNNTNDAISDLNDKIDENANYSLHIVAPNGTNIHGGNIILNVLLYKNSVDVTDEFEPSCFVWTRASKDSYGDLYWNDQHKTGAKSLTITANDVRINADFQCRFEYGDFNIETV